MNKTHKQKERESFGIICSSIALLLSIVLIVLWCFNAGGFTVVTLDSFVAVIVSLLAVIVTFVLGWQIYNTIELKEKIKELENLKGQFAAQNETINNLTIKTRHINGLILGLNAHDRKEYINAFRYFIISLHCSLLLSKPLNIQRLSKQITLATKKMKKGDRLSDLKYQEVIDEHDIIVQLPGYELIKEWLEPAYEQFLKKANL